MKKYKKTKQPQHPPKEKSNSLAAEKTKHADHLLRLTHFPDLVGKPVVRSELVYMLVKLDKAYAAEQPSAPWEDYYAEKLSEHFA